MRLGWWRFSLRGNRHPNQNIDDNREGKSDTQIIQQFKEGIMKDIKNKYIIDMQELPKVAKSILDLFQDVLDDDTNMISEDELLSWFQTDNKIAEQLDTLKKLMIYLVRNQRRKN